MDDDTIHNGGGAAFYKPTETLRDLQALEAIERDPAITQRTLSQRLGVALGISNSLIHTLVRKGLIKIRGEGRRSITYHLTHKGLLEKGRLAAQYTMNTIDFYRLTRQAVAKTLGRLHDSGVRTVVFYGWNELAEISSVVAAQIPLEVVGALVPEVPEVSQVSAVSEVSADEAVDPGDANGAIETTDAQVPRPPQGMQTDMASLASSAPDAIIICQPVDEPIVKALKRDFPGSLLALVPSGDILSEEAE